MTFLWSNLLLFRLSQLGKSLGGILNNMLFPGKMQTGPLGEAFFGSFKQGLCVPECLDTVEEVRR